MCANSGREELRQLRRAPTRSRRAYRTQRAATWTLSRSAFVAKNEAMEDAARNREKDREAHSSRGTGEVEIAIEAAEDLFREIRIENTLTDVDGNPVALKNGAEVDVTFEAEVSDTVSRKTHLA